MRNAAGGTMTPEFSSARRHDAAPGLRRPVGPEQ